MEELIKSRESGVRSKECVMVERLNGLRVERLLKAGYTHNCHPELDSGSYQQTSVECNAGEIPDQVRNDNKRNNSGRRPHKGLLTPHASPLTKRVAFTMAEILLSLTIIGVVAAITLPSLTGNINERAWNAQRKALYSRMSQAIALMPSLNNYGTLTQDENKNTTADTATETFITNGLSKVLKINNVCDSDHLGDCGIPDKMTDLVGSTISNVHTELNHLTGLNYMFNGTASDTYNRITYSQIDTKAAAFETQNGESILAYYNPKCSVDKQKSVTQVLTSYQGRDWIQEKVCANFIYDLNGSKGPNTVGKDIGVITVFYPIDGIVVAPYTKKPNFITVHTYSNLNKLCQDKYGEDHRGPAKEEMGAIWVNRKLFGIESENRSLLSTTRYLAPDGTFYRWTMSMNYGFYGLTALNGEGGASWVICVER